MGENLWEPTLQQLQAWIPLDSAFDAEDEAFLGSHRVQTTAQVWTFGPHHFQERSAPPLFNAAWITPYAWHNNTEADHRYLKQACPEMQYFIKSHASRIQFYFSRIKHIVCPVSFEHPYPLQILAAGAQLWVPERYQASLPASLVKIICTYRDVASLAEELNASTTSLVAEDFTEHLAPFDLTRVLPERLAELTKSSLLNSGASPSPAVRDTTRLLHASGAHVLDVLMPLLYQTEIQTQAWHPLVECVVYLRFLLGDFVQDPQDKERIYRHVLGLSQRISEKPVQVLCRYFVYKLRLNYHAAGEAITQLLESIDHAPGECRVNTEQSLHYCLYLLQDVIFLELTLTPEIDVATGVRAWINFQHAYLLAYTERQPEAAGVLASTRSLATPPILGNLWCALGNYRASAAEAKEWKQAYPLHIWIGLKYIEALHRTEAPSQALINHEIQRLKALCVSLNGTSHELERVLTYERIYSPSPPLDTTVIQWEGPLYSYSSLAQINAYWLKALAQDKEYTPVHIPFEPPEQKYPVVDPCLPELTAQKPDFFISHRWPPRTQAPEAGAWISIIPWEFGAIPQLWVERINQAEMHGVWVPSAYVAHSFWRSGVIPEKLTVIPNGVDTRQFCPEGPLYPLQTQKSFCFLFVGGALHRKGLDILLKAYTAVFSAHDDVCLVIKVFGGDSHYAVQSILPKASSNAPEIEYITQDLLPEEMAALYRRCQVYVHPYRGEGFALPILEAMASGTPVMIPDAGPAPEFCSEAAGWYLPTRICSDGAMNIANQGVAPVHAYFTTVDDSVLAAQMQAVQRTQDWKAKGRQAAKEALAYDWERLYPRLKQSLQAMGPRHKPNPSAGVPSRLYLDNPWELLPLYNTPELQFVNDRVLAEQSLFYCLNPGDIKFLQESSQDLSEGFAICATESLRHALVEGGWPLEQSCVQELLISTQSFSPSVKALYLEESADRFTFLLCFDWQKPGHWQDILKAYLAAFRPGDPVHLIFKPYNAAFDVYIEAFMEWFESTGIAEEQLPDITFMEDPLSSEQLPAFLRGVDCFIDNYSEALALAAIASEVAVITGSSLPCLQRPAAERYRFMPKTLQSELPEIHQGSLIYLLQDLVARPGPLQRRHANQDLRTRQAHRDWQKELCQSLWPTRTL